MWKAEDILSYIKTSRTEEILESLKISNELTIEESKNIFLFLYDYTNSFKNANTTPDILRLAGIMLESWIEHDMLIVEKTKKTFSQMKLNWDIIETIQLYKFDTIAWAVVTGEMLEKHCVNSFLWKSFMSNMLITISGCDFWFLMVEEKNSWFRILLGSKFDINNLDEVRKRLWITEENNIIHWKTKEEIIELITQ
jgi:nanoRNase/pAp phosphatase (c-di-AMP/oligoRNAs hydrolase)